MRITSTNQKATTAASTTRPASGTAVAPASGLGRRRIAGPGMVVWSNLISRARKPFGTRRAATPDVNRVLHRRRGAATYPLGGGYASGEIALGGMAYGPLPAYSRCMPKNDDPASIYPCMMPRENLRLVHEPNDERVVLTRSRLKRALAKLAAAIR